MSNADLPPTNDETEQPSQPDPQGGVQKIRSATSADHPGIPEIEDIEIGAELGRGALAVVYKGRQKILDRDVAIKILSKKNLEPDASSIARFLQEAKLTSSLSHANIAKVMSFGVSSTDDPFLVMEYVNGATLAEFMNNTDQLSLEQFKNIFSQLLSALSYAHEKGIVHRDIKPGNVILTISEEGKNTVKLVDFGIAKVLAESDSNQNKTRTGVLLGTPAYMSPEQCAGKPLDGRSDLYSLACMMHHFLCGVPPFQSESSWDFMNQHINAAPPSAPLIAKKAAIKLDLASIISSGLSKNPEDRPQTAKSFAEQLMPLLESANSDDGLSERQEIIKQKKTIATVAIVGAIAVLLIIFATAMMPESNDTQPGLMESEEKSIPRQFNDVERLKGGNLKDQLKALQGYRSIISELEASKTTHGDILAKAYAQAGETIVTFLLMPQTAHNLDPEWLKSISESFGKKGTQLSLQLNKPVYYLRNAKNYFARADKNTSPETIIKIVEQANEKWPNSMPAQETHVEGILCLINLGDLERAEHLLRTFQNNADPKDNDYQKIWSEAIGAAIKTRKGHKEDGQARLNRAIADLDTTATLGTRTRKRILETTIAPTLKLLKPNGQSAEFMKKEFLANQKLYEAESPFTAGDMCELVATYLSSANRLDEAIEYREKAIKIYQSRPELDGFVIAAYKRLIPDLERAGPKYAKELNTCKQKLGDSFKNRGE